MFKNSVKSVLNIICISFLVSTGAFAQYAVMPWVNNSSYYGKWNLSLDIPAYTSKLSREMFQLDFISPGTILSKSNKVTAEYFTSGKRPDVEILHQLCTDAGTQYAILGKIENFALNRYLAGEPIVAGYEHYSCTLDAELQLYDNGKGIVIENFPVSATITKNSLGFSLIGKPSEEKIEFYNFDKMPFGGENFEKTLVGETMVDFVKKMHESIADILKEKLKQAKSDSVTNSPLQQHHQNSKTPAMVSGEIILYDKESGEAFVNLGTEAQLNVGDRLVAYTPGEALKDPQTGELLGYADRNIATLEITEICGPKLSLVTAPKQNTLLHKGVKVKPVKMK